MRCPKCRKDTSVIDSRSVSQREMIRRRRECDACHYRFTTYEAPYRIEAL